MEKGSQTLSLNPIPVMAVMNTSIHMGAPYFFENSSRLRYITWHMNRAMRNQVMPTIFTSKRLRAIFGVEPFPYRAGKKYPVNMFSKPL